MKIKTLEHIHYLLREDVETSKEKYDKAFSAKCEMEEDEGVTRSSVKAQEEFVDDLRKRWFKAFNALEDFDAYDWR